MPERKEIRDDATVAAQKLRSIEEFATEPIGPPLAEFARFLADRINDGNIVPMGFMIAANLGLYDLEQGVNGFTGKPIESSLVGRTPEFYAMLTASLPSLARLAFSEEFADAFDNEFQETMGAYIAQSEKQTQEPTEVTVDPDIITVPIRDISQAKQQIIEDGINRALTLDWGHFGLTDMVELRKLLDATWPLTLRNAGMNFQLSILNLETPREKALAEALPDDRKIHIVDKFWLVMLGEVIEPEEATFMRDWLWIKAPESIATFKGLPKKRVVDHLTQSSPALGKATFRAGIYLAQRGKTPL